MTDNGLIKALCDALGVKPDEARQILRIVPSDLVVMMPVADLIALASSIATACSSHYHAGRKAGVEDMLKEQAARQIAEAEAQVPSAREGEH